MKIKMDAAGRIVMPKPLRDRLGIRPETELEAVEQSGGVLLRPVEQKPPLIKVDGLWVHQGAPQKGANWDRILTDLREQRIDSLFKG